jgi:hypothetical protein
MANGLFQIKDENLPVSNLTRVRSLRDCVYHLVSHFRCYGDFHFYFGDKINCIFRPSISFSVTGLGAEAFDFTYHHAADANLRYRFPNFLELEGFDRCNN